jgi:hypothetical protein
LANSKKAGAHKHHLVMHQHEQHAEASGRPTNEEYEDSSVSSVADMEKEMIAANALNEGTTNPYEDPIAEDHHQHHQQHIDGGDVEKQTSRRSIQSGNAAAVDGLEKQTTRRSVRSGKAVSVNNVSAIPNGGTTAWLQVLGAFFLFFNSWGISKNNHMKSTRIWLITPTVNTFGAYQTYYQSGILSSSSPSDISWIGSVQAFLLMLVGALTGPIYDAGYFRALLSVGSFLVVFGFMMLSLASTYWQVILAQGICVGLGAGCLFVPSVAILSTYFSTRVATAMGLAAAGSSLGKLFLYQP